MPRWKKSTRLLWLILVASMTVFGYFGWVLTLGWGIAITIAAMFVVSVGMWIEKNEDEREGYQVVGITMGAMGGGMVLGSLVRILMIALGLDPCSGGLC